MVDEENETTKEKLIIHEEDEEQQDRKLNKDWLWSFTKRVVAYVCVIYAIAFLCGLFCALYALFVLQDITLMETFTASSGEIFRDVVVGYCIKAGVENYQKIKKLFTE